MNSEVFVSAMTDDQLIECIESIIFFLESDDIPPGFFDLSETPSMKRMHNILSKYGHDMSTFTKDLSIRFRFEFKLGNQRSFFSDNEKRYVFKKILRELKINKLNN